MRIVKRTELTEPPTKEEVVSRAICRGDRRFQTSMEHKWAGLRKKRELNSTKRVAVFAAHCNDIENNNDRVDDCTERRDKKRVRTLGRVAQRCGELDRAV